MKRVTEGLTDASLASDEESIDTSRAGSFRVSSENLLSAEVTGRSLQTSAEADVESLLVTRESGVEHTRRKKISSPTSFPADFTSIRYLHELADSFHNKYFCKS